MTSLSIGATRLDFVFEPNTPFWNVVRERVLLVASVRALMMQAAHPMVAQAVEDHSYMYDNPLRRYHRTVGFTYRIIFGTRADVDAAVSEINAAHRQATGKLDQASGRHAAETAYSARNPRYGLWVYASLIENGISTYEHFVAPLAPEDRDAYYQQSKAMANMLGVANRYLPESYDDLLDYMQDAIDSGEVAVSDHALRIARFLNGRTLPFVNAMTYVPFRITIGLLPPDIRTQYGYAFNSTEERLLKTLCATSRALLPLVPGPLRFAPEYRHAQRLLRRAGT